jgi:hypothetical protein
MHSMQYYGALGHAVIINKQKNLAACHVSAF